MERFCPQSGVYAVGIMPFVLPIRVSVGIMSFVLPVRVFIVNGISIKKYIKISIEFIH